MYTDIATTDTGWRNKVTSPDGKEVLRLYDALETAYFTAQTVYALKTGLNSLADALTRWKNTTRSADEIAAIEGNVWKIVGGIDKAGVTLSKRIKWLNDLKSKYDFNLNFSPQGLEPTTISIALKKEILNGFSSELPNSLKESIFNVLIKSGSTLPLKKTLNVGDELYKIVPKGNGYTKSSFYISKSEFDVLKNSSDIEQKLGLPLSSHAVEYDVYKATAKQRLDVFESTVANTNQGGYITTGGARQTFLLDDSKWTITLETNTLTPSK